MNWHWPEHYTRAVKMAAARWNVTDWPGVERSDLEQVAAEKLARTRPEGPALAYTTAVRAIIDWARVHGPRSQGGTARPRHTELPDPATSSPSDVAALTVPGHEDAVVACDEHARRLAWLRRMLQRLPRRQRQAMTHLVEGVPASDSAILLNMSEDSVAANRHQGKATLRKWAHRDRIR